MSNERVRQQKRIQLSPYYLGNILSGIERELNNKLMCYSDKLNGTVINYDNINIIDSISHIIDDIPFICIDIEIDFLILKFKKGTIINGKLTEITGIKYNEKWISYIKCNKLLFEKTKETDKTIINMQ